jgi:serpin B
MFKEFHTAAGNVFKVPTMFRSYEYCYWIDDWCEGVELPYEDRDVVMLLLMPRIPYVATTAPIVYPKIEELEKLLTAQYVDHILHNLVFGNVILSVPRWKTAQSYDLSQPLKQLGMKAAFGPDADFSGMSADPLRISTVIHKACIDVDEYGTTASASHFDNIYIGVNNSWPVEITFDRPFVYLIVEKPTGLILFGGRVANPMKEN